MDEIMYEVPLVKQGVQECLPASATQLLNFHGSTITFDEVKKDVPLYITPDGKPVGTSVGHMGAYLLQKGFSVTFHTVDIEIFDPSWKGLSSGKLHKKLQERRKFITHSRYDDEILDVIFEGYLLFLQNRGKVEFPVVEVDYLREKLTIGPFILQVSYNYLNNCSKYTYDDEAKKPIHDDIRGATSTHAVVVSGYKNGKFIIVDPDFEFGGVREIDPRRLIGAFYLAETDFDPILITISKK